jgi:hypothetical protein
MIALLTAVCIGSVSFLGGSTNDSFLMVSSAVDGNDTLAGSPKRNPDERAIVKRDGRTGRIQINRDF